MSTYTRSTRGFTLIEMAVALFIITLVLGSLLVPLTTQVEQRKTAETQRILDQAMEALLGFAAVNGRLPCPASSTSNGLEVLVIPSPNGGQCSNPFNGFFPAATLGISPVDAQGYLVDGWGSVQNRVRYAVTNTNPVCSPYPYTTAGGLRACWSTITGGGALPTLSVCSTSTGINVGDCAAGAKLTDKAPALIYSLGKNAPTGGTGADEAENLSNDRAFVWHTQAAAGATNGEFDDIMVWMSPNILYSKLINAGQLP
jgi:prepilin-type N-terminal cleavage/methylation domain-containing protein